jgi:hypothetical protein
MEQLHVLKIIANLCSALKTFLGLVLIFSTTTAQADFTTILTGNPEVQRKYDEAFEKAMQQQGNAIFKDLSRDIAPYSPELSEQLDKARRKIPGIKFRQGLGIQTSGKKMSCMMADNSTWTADAGKRPQITMSNDIDRDLFVHEVISASGIVDDEYQVSGPVLTVRDQIDAGEITAELGRDLLGSVDVKMRQGTLSYKIDTAREQCYDKQGRFLSTGGDGTATGVGGGGNTTALGFKKILLLWAPQWRKEVYGNAPMDKRFMKKMTELGVEPLIENRTGLIDRRAMDFTFSKRTKKLVVRLYLDDTTQSASSMSAAAQLIYEHIDNELKTKQPFKDSHCIYGGTLARAMGLLSEKESNSKDVWGMKKYCFK